MDENTIGKSKAEIVLIDILDREDFRKLKTDLDFAKAIFKICNNCDSAWDMDNDIVYVLKKFHVFKNKQDEKRK